jgi:carboxyl-terminal processing protease
VKRLRTFAIALITIVVLTAACAEAVLGPTSNTNHAAIFDDMWREFDLHYSFFELKDLNWDTLRAVYRPGAVAALNDVAFAAQLGAMLRQLKDVHVSLTTTGPGTTFGYVSPFDTVATNFSVAATLQNYVPRATQTTGHHLEYGLAAPTVGYVRIASFGGQGWDGEMDEAIAAMPPAKSMIVDVRDNRGGTTELSTSIAGRFTANAHPYGWVRLRNGPKHDDFTDYIGETVSPAGTKKFRGAVYVLTNRRDFSSAEDFVLAMRALPRVTVVGDTTAGASGGPISRELANGWSYELSEWIEYTPAKQTFEGIGLAPDVFVRATAADATAGRDAALERALAMAGR